MVGKALLNFKLKLRWNHFNLENWHYLWEKCLYSIVKKLAQNICASFTWSSPSSHRVSGFKYFKGAKPLNKSQNRRQVKNSLKKTADILQYQQWFLSFQWRLKDECKNSVFMTRHYLDLSGASDWLRQISHMARPIRSTPKISVVTTISQMSICGETSGGTEKCWLFSQVSWKKRHFVSSIISLHYCTQANSNIIWMQCTINDR